MKLLAFTVYDEKAECFGNPFFVSAPGQATRMFADLSRDKQTTVGQHPEDFTLYQVGTWNNSEAKFDNLTTPKFICKATDSILTPTEMYSVPQAEKDRKETA